MSSINIDLYSECPSNLPTGTISIPFDSTVDTYDNIATDIILPGTTKTLSISKNGDKIQGSTEGKTIPCLILSEVGGLGCSFKIYASNNIDNENGKVIYKRTNPFINTITILPGQIPMGRFLTLKVITGAIKITSGSQLIIKN